MASAADEATFHGVNLGNTNSRVTVYQDGESLVLRNSQEAVTVGKAKEKPREEKKMYSCSVCQRQFTRNNYKKNHERTHTGEKPFGCKVCGKKFSRDHHLVVHMRVHTGGKPYSCTLCHQGFSQSSCLTSHMRKIHVVERPKRTITNNDAGDRVEWYEPTTTPMESGLVDLTSVMFMDQNNMEDEFPISQPMWQMEQTEAIDLSIATSVPKHYFLIYPAHIRSSVPFLY